MKITTEDVFELLRECVEDVAREALMEQNPGELVALTPEGREEVWAAAEPRFRAWLDKVKAEAWEEGAQAAWLRTGDGWNGEYVEGTHDGSRSFRDCNPDTPNPYRTQDRK